MSSADLPQLITDIQSHARDTRFEAVSNLRKLLSIEREPPIDAAIAAGALPLLVELLMPMHDGEPQLQYQSAWALTNITAGSSAHVNAVFEAGALSVLIERCCASPFADVREQSLWCLGNIAGDSPRFRDVALAFGALQPVLENLGDPDHPRVVRTGAWVLANLLRGSPPPSSLRDMAPMVMRALTFLLSNSDDVDVVADAVRALASLSDNAAVDQAALIAVAPKLVQLVRTRRDVGTLDPLLSVLGALAAESDAHRQVLLDADVLDGLARTLSDEELACQTCWVIGGLLGGSAAQVQTVLDAEGWLHALTRVAHSAPLDSAGEAAIALANATTNATRAQIDQLLLGGLLRTLHTPHARGCSDPRYARALGRAVRNLSSSGVEMAALESSGLLAIVNLKPQQT